MDFDAIVIGAGPAGCLAARDLAFGGWSVGLFDAAGRQAVGRPIIVEVEQSIFRRVGLAPPTRDEVPYRPRALRLFSPRRRQVLVLRGELPTVALYHDRLCRTLVRMAEEAGARFFGEYRALGALVGSARVLGARFEHQRGEHEVRARLVVDATGYDAAMLRGLDPVLGMTFVDDSRDVVMASASFDEIHPDEACEAVASGLSGDDEVWTTLGAHGVCSTEWSYLSLRKARAFVLVGQKADREGPPVRTLMAAHQRRLGYFRSELCAFEGRIRVCRALDRLVTAGLMVIGEAACTVNPVTGAGVASAMHSGTLAGHVGAEALANRAPSTGDLWRYAARYQRGRGAALATFDALRRSFERLGEAELGAALEAGLVGPQSFALAESARLPSVAPRALVRRSLALARHPTLIPTVARLTAAGSAVFWHYRSYPDAWDPERFAAWRARGRKLFAGVD